MNIALTGTPGTGKTSVAEKLENKKYSVINLNDLSSEKNFFKGYDKKRDSKIIDIKKLNNYIKKNISTDIICILDSHISHLVKSVDKVFLLRCHPEELRLRLKKKQWKKTKIDENIEAEILDIILCETLEVHKKDNVFEIDTTKKNLEEVAEIVDSLIKNDFKQDSIYIPGKIDWSEELLKIKNSNL